MFSPGDLVAAQWCLYRVLIAERTWRYHDAGNGALFVFLGAYKWDESLLLSREGRVCRIATVHLVGVLCLSPAILFVSALMACTTRGITSSYLSPCSMAALRARSSTSRVPSIGSTLISFGGCDGIQTR